MTLKGKLNPTGSKAKFWIVISIAIIIIAISLTIYGINLTGFFSKPVSITETTSSTTSSSTTTSTTVPTTTTTTSTTVPTTTTTTSTTVPTTTTTTTIKNIYTARESIELFGDRWKVIQLLANDFVYKEYIQNKGCSPTPCNRDYWAVTSIKDSLYYKNENYWIVNVILEFRNLEEQKIWYEYFNVTVDQATGSVLNYQKI